MKNRYLARLYDQMALRVLANTKDFDARDEDYPTKVSAVVWQTVRRLRLGRQVFRAEIRREVREQKKRVPTSSKPPKP